MKYLFTTIVLTLVFTTPAWAKLKVVTTTTTLRSVVEAIGGEYVQAESIARGSQDPHFVEAKPSYMVQLRNADLLVVVGLDLEVGWIPNVARGARNPEILPGRKGYLDTGSLIEAIEVPKGRVDRSLGDIHPGGNPHFYLDPIRMGQVARVMADRLALLDAAHKEVYLKNSMEFEKRVQTEMVKWKQRVLKSSVTKVITYHRTLNYFLSRFGIEFSGSIESKPGIPPTTKHVLSLIETVKKDKISCILVESYFETKSADRIRQDTKTKMARVATEVEALPKTNNYIELIESLVTAIESCG